jgi:Domain of unknown function (DUF4265)
VTVLTLSSTRFCRRVTGRSGSSSYGCESSEAMNSSYAVTPFFLYDIALGDIVHTRPREGRQYVLDKVTEPSGRYVFRVWFGESFYPRQDVVDELERIGALLEWSSRNLLVVDAEDKARAQEIATYLDDREKHGALNFETARTS